MNLKSDIFKSTLQNCARNLFFILKLRHKIIKYIKRLRLDTPNFSSFLLIFNCSSTHLLIFLINILMSFQWVFHKHLLRINLFRDLKTTRNIFLYNERNVIVNIDRIILYIWNRDKYNYTYYYNLKTIIIHQNSLTLYHCFFLN